MKGRIKSLIILCMICFFAISVQTVAFASDEDFFPEVEVPVEYADEPVLTSGIIIKPFLSYIFSMDVGLKISGNKATCSGVLTGGSNTTKMAIFMYLQKYDYSAGAWKTYASWSEVASGRSVTLSESTTITSGTYRAKMSCWGYNGTLSENTIIYSSAYAK